MDFPLPGFVALHRDGELHRRVVLARRHLQACDLCARHCGVNREAGERGQCRGGLAARVSSAFPHLGEEDVLRGSRGSGTVFLAGCSLHCTFCQNWEISHLDRGDEVSTATLARTFAHLAEMGCHNLNFVTPSHYLVPLLEGLEAWISAVPEGPFLPVVWNCSGYESPEDLELLDGIVDVYMPDVKFFDPDLSARYLDARDYPERVMSAVETMVGQVGSACLGEEGTLVRGVLVRHLVMPGAPLDTEAILSWLAQRFGRTILVNVMGQYRPCGGAGAFPEIDRPVTAEEWRGARRRAADLGLVLA